MKIGQKFILGFVGIALWVGVVGSICLFQTKIAQNIANVGIYKGFSRLNNAWAMMEAIEHQYIAAIHYLFLEGDLREKRANYFEEKERLERV
jgi:hypothetical protein